MSSGKGLRASAPVGMDAALEGLARAVLKQQPDPDAIYAFAARHFGELISKRQMATAHNAGISPSSTQESNSKQQPGSEDGASTRPNEERSIAEEPESNDTSYGVEATAVRTLAATTGTVAILGTTAKTIQEELETKEDAEPAVVAGVEADTSTPPPAAERTTPSEPQVQVKSPVSDSNKSEISSPEVKSPVLPVESPTKIAEEVSEVVSESKEKDEDLSSERLKTNSISNTTLSSDSIIEIENNSVKQSPSADKVIESFDSSSTVEFVDSTVKDLAKNVISNPARSISSELSNKVLPVDGEKTPEILSPVGNAENEDLPPPPPPETLNEIADAGKTSTNQKHDTPVLVEPSELEESSSSSKEPVNDEGSIHSEISSNVSSSVQSVIRVDPGNQDTNSRSAIENSPNASDDNHKAETGSPFSSDSNSPLNGNGEIPSPVTAVVVSPVESNKEAEQFEKKSPSKEETALTNGISSKTETPNITPVNSPTDTSISNTVKVNGDLENALNHSKESKTNGESLQMPDLEDEKVIAAATTIQASYRGFQERKNLKVDKNGEVDKIVNVINDSEKPAEIVEKPINRSADESSSILDDVNDKMTTAATTIQANFRGFQTRQNLKNKTDSGLPPSEETNLSDEVRTPTTLSPELIESVKEEVEEICKEAESIVAERSESGDWVKGVQQVVVGCKLPAASVSESIQAMRGSTTPPEVSEADDAREEVFDADDSAVIQAATTIQASFRGFQARKTLQGNNTDRRDSMPNYPPPPADEEMPSLGMDDLPPPDFDALESSYSEDVPTEPLAPPPDSLVFNEEDEDELMSLQQLQRPQECDELPEHRLTDSSDSSLSSAATKIQAGVRGYLTRKQIQGQGGTGTTSTSTGVLDSVSDRSQSLEESARSPEQESEVCRHRASPEPPLDTGARGPRAGGKRMSLAEPAPPRTRPPLRTALSVQGGGSAASDQDVWSTLKNEMSDAATLIQSNFRGYRARKQLQREDAVQVTSGSSQSGSAEAGRGSAASGEDKPGSRQEDKPNGLKQDDTKHDDDTTARCSGEYHDIIALSPPGTANKEGGGAQAHGGGASTGPPHDDTDAMVKRRADDPEATAATKIQATFRGFKARQGMREEDRAAAKIQAGFRGYKVRKEMKKQRPEAQQTQAAAGAQEAGAAAGVEETTTRAATKIQAGVRGFLVRRRNRKDRPKTDDQ